MSVYLNVIYTLQKPSTFNFRIQSVRAPKSRKSAKEVTSGYVNDMSRAIRSAPHTPTMIAVISHPGFYPGTEFEILSSPNTMLECESLRLNWVSMPSNANNIQLTTTKSTERKLSSLKLIKQKPQQKKNPWATQPTHEIRANLSFCGPKSNKTTT